MKSEPKKETLYTHWSSQRDGLRYFLNIEAELPEGVTRRDKEFDEAIPAAVRLLEDAIVVAFHRNNPESQLQAANQIEGLLGCFPDYGDLYTSVVTNGYCSRACCRHLPWYVVTTRIGEIKLGWRKNVIHLEWTDTVVEATAEELFPSENTTKYYRVIHCWGYEKCREYLAKIFDFAKVNGLLTS